MVIVASLNDKAKQIGIDKISNYTHNIRVELTERIGGMNIISITPSWVKFDNISAWTDAAMLCDGKECYCDGQAISDEYNGIERVAFDTIDGSTSKTVTIDGESVKITLSGGLSLRG